MLAFSIIEKLYNFLKKYLDLLLKMAFINQI